jgi:hypothetical protein
MTYVPVQVMEILYNVNDNGERHTEQVGFGVGFIWEFSMLDPIP